MEPQDETTHKYPLVKRFKSQGPPMWNFLPGKSKKSSEYLTLYINISYEFLFSPWSDEIIRMRAAKQLSCTHVRDVAGLCVAGFCSQHFCNNRSWS